MNQEKLYSFDSDDWKMLEKQFSELYQPVFSFVLENKGSMNEARTIYVEAFIYYLQLLELKGLKLSQNAEGLLYSFSRKLWLHKLEKRRVDLDFVKHRREFYEMEESFHEIDAINQRSAKTASKLAEIGEPHRTLLLEGIGRQADLHLVASRLGFSDESRVFAKLGQAVMKLIKLTEGKEFNLDERRYHELLRYALDGMEPHSMVASDEEKVCLAMVSRVIAMVRNHVNRSERTQRFKQIEEKCIPQSLDTIDQFNQQSSKSFSIMKVLAIFFAVILAAAGVSALTAFGVSDSLHKQQAENAALAKASADSIAEAERIAAIPVKLPPQGISAFAIGHAGYVLTTAKPLRDAKSIELHCNNWDRNFTAQVVVADTVNDLALLYVNEIPAESARLPYRLSPQQNGLGESLYSLGFPKGQMQYSDASMSALEKTGNAQVQMLAASAGAPLIGLHGQVAGMVLSSSDDDDQVHAMIPATKIQDWLSAKIENDSIDMHLNTRNGFFFHDKPKQIEMLQNFVYKVKIKY